jgi:uncharacterized protein YkwD
MRLPTLLTAAATAFLLLIPAAAQAAACPGADTPIDADDVPAARAALLCLHNAERARRDLPPLHADAELRDAGQDHAADMVRRHYFEHTSPSGVPFDARVKSAGYTKRAPSWAIAENLAWGDAGITPADLMRMWLASPEHRRSLLGRYRDVGIGISPGTPWDPAGATVAVEFGRLTT